MGFKAGDKIRFLHEKGEATVIAVVSPYKLRVELDEGLEIEVHVSEIAAIKEMPLEKIVVSHKESSTKKSKKTVSKPHASDEMEVDLHIEELTDDSYNMSNAQKLNLQLAHFQDALDKAIKGHVRKIIVIHGVGNGVLRQSIRDVLKRYQGIEYSDGSYRKYGAGATEVRITAKSKAK
jgi:dsDNA-specific endonuclease/ATPase MutS2